MHLLIRSTVVIALFGVLTVLACVDSNEAPAVVASIEAFTSTPQVVNQSERVELRWRAENSLVFRLSRLVRNAVPEEEPWPMPDDTQPWSCTREGSSMVCTAPEVPGSANGWACAEGSCRRPVTDDTATYRQVEVPPTATHVGSLEMWPDQTTIYRVEAEGNAGTTATAWVQVVYTREDVPRIVSWFATPSPALAGEPVTFEYRTEGCEGVEYAASPTLNEDEFELEDGYTDEQGTLTWHDADQTRDFYFGCHPLDTDDSVRIRSHITVPVLEMPEICERVDYFSVVPAGNVAPGTEITVEWRVSSPPATSVSGDADPQPPDREFRIGSARFEGSWVGTIFETTTFTIRAYGECRGAQARHTVTVNEDCHSNCVGRECGDDGCGGSCGTCAEGLTCDYSSGQCIAEG